MQDKLKSREITHDTKWREFVRSHLKDNPAYLNLVGQHGQTPHEIFEDALSEERDLLSMHKPPFKNLVKVFYLVISNFDIDQRDQVCQQCFF